MADLAQRRMEVEEFLDWSGEGETRYQLRDGIPVAMAPGSLHHGRLISHLNTAIAAALRGALEIGSVKFLDLASVVKNASVSELTFSRTRVTPTLFNAIDHLPRDLWTHR